MKIRKWGIVKRAVEKANILNIRKKPVETLLTQILYGRGCHLKYIFEVKRKEEEYKYNV